MEPFVVSIKSLSEKLLHRQINADVNEVIESLFNEISSLEGSARIQDAQLEENAIQLWNWAVTKRAGSTITEEQKAKVRHVACRLLHSCGPENPSENVVRKQILMASKTGRTWLDCKQPKLADDFLHLAVCSLETLYSRLTSHGDCADDINTPKGEIEKDLLRVLSYQAESAVSQERHQEAVSCMQRCKEMLMRLPKESGYLSLICYNFGVDTYSRGKHEESSFWLSQSYDIGKMNTKYSPGPEMQAKVLRLLATVYLEWDCQKYLEKALHAVSLANKENMQPTGLCLKIRILVRSASPDDAVKSGLSELLNCDVPLNVCLGTVKLLVAEDRESLAFDFLKKVCQQFEWSPELGSALLLHIELLLQRGRELLAKQKIEDAITGHYTGKQLSPQILSSLHHHLWDKASKNFEAKNYSEALHWYNYSLSFYRSGQLDQNLAKLQRNRSSCFLHLQQLEKAKEAVEEAERIDPTSIFTQFNIYKIAVMANNVERAAVALREISTLAQTPVSSEDRLLVAENAAANLLSLAAQLALEHEQQKLAIKALESLCEHSQDVVQVLTALRCLVRLVLSTVENISEGNRHASMDVLLSYLKTALQKASQMNHIPGQGLDERSDKANWFRKIAWNLALQCEHSPVTMRDFFLLSYQLSQLCAPDRGVLIGQKTCLLMVAAASLEICRNMDHTEQQTELLTQTLEHIQICKEVWKTITASGTSCKDPTDRLLLLYEFEARAKLNDAKLESVLESVLELDNVEAKVLETIAVLAMEPPAHFPVLCKKALRIALSLHRKEPQVDLTRCSNCVHSLIQLTLPSGVSEVEPHALEEVWGYYEEALSIIATAPKDFPELEILWLLTRAWNTGILLYSLAQYPEAERWCGLGMSFLRHLGSLQDSYQTQMAGLYSEVLDRLDKAKKNVIIEE
ncbi:putative testis-expressed sequence 11 protein [Triplophysa rosa]|uniref:Protein ZIP4 homolog n=1 Tax=Triplophysa rosa TaxID=992332 RepID=A0A9W7TSE1_TRIRA|nr:putative testis-expressed sequence 11 protein [Triplophysa rosa]